MKYVSRYLLLSQLALMSLLALCCLIFPSVVARNGGVSNFGNAHSTVLPYSLSFLLCIVFLGLAAIKLIRISQAFRKIAVLLIGLCVLYLLVLISTFPRHRSLTYSELHDDLGIALFAYEFGLSLWFVIKRPSLAIRLILFGEAVGSFIGLLSILKVIHLLFIGQIVGAAGFGLLLVLSLPVILEATPHNSPAPKC